MKGDLSLSERGVRAHKLPVKPCSDGRILTRKLLIGINRQKIQLI